MAATITEISIRGYKSIERLDRLPLRSLNVLVGANGAGKSNFVGFVGLFRTLLNRSLRLAIDMAGGADSVLHLGPAVTTEMRGSLAAGEHVFEFALTATADNRLAVASEVAFRRRTGSSIRFAPDDHTHDKSYLLATEDRPAPSTGFTPVDDLRRILSGLSTYQFDDTSPTAGVRRWGGINDDERLRPDASNLAAFLYRIRHTHPDHLARIRDVVRLAAPFFDDFKLRPITTNPDQIQLEWTQVGTDYPFRPSQLSDGTLRFICLATALLQPGPPAVMMFDEPELGLHPYALTLLATLFHEAADGPAQVIVSTQSATLLNEVDAEDVIVVERANGASTFRRLDPAALSEWLADYAVGDLWQKNLFGGRPRPELGGAR